MAVNVSDIKILREKTSISYAECKKALQDANGNIESALDNLRNIGHQVANQVKDRDVRFGIIECYIHAGNRIGTMVEILCETDFVAKTNELKKFAKEVAMQVAATNPFYISKEDIPSEILLKEKNRIDHISEVCQLPLECTQEYVDRLKEARLGQWFSEVCLLEQPYIKDNAVSVGDLLSQLIIMVGENCKISKIQRWEIGICNNSQYIPSHAFKY